MVMLFDYSLRLLWVVDLYGGLRMFFNITVLLKGVHTICYVYKYKDFFRLSSLRVL